MEANRVVVAIVLGIIVVAGVAGIAYLMKGNVDSDVDDQTGSFSDQLDCIMSKDDSIECTGGSPERDDGIRIKQV